MEQHRISRWQSLWENHKTVLIVITCLFPILFIPLWIILLIIERFSKQTAGPIGEVLSAEAGGEQPITTDSVLSAGGLIFFGFIGVVGLMACILGVDVVDRARGPGGGIALLMGYVLIAGGAGGAIAGIVGLVSRIRALK